MGWQHHQQQQQRQRQNNYIDGNINNITQQHSGNSFRMVVVFTRYQQLLHSGTSTFRHTDMPHSICPLFVTTIAISPKGKKLLVPPPKKTLTLICSVVWRNFFSDNFYASLFSYCFYSQKVEKFRYSHFVWNFYDVFSGFLISMKLLRFCFWVCDWH